jgi:type I restriction enzyme S subunit
VSELPEGWLEVNIFDLCRPKQWKTISIKYLTNSGYIVYGANGEIGFYKEFTHEDPTLMITCRGATCGNIHVSKPYSYINGNAMALDYLKQEVCHLNYLKFYLMQRGFDDIISGSAQPQITQQGLQKVFVPLAPLNEQKRIADKLDRLLARVDACREKCDRIPPILKRFRQSVLAAATSGQLTEDWRDLQSKTTATQIVSLKDVALNFNYGTSAKSSRTGSIPVLRMGNIQDGRLDWNDLVFTSDADEIEKYKYFPEMYYLIEQIALN